MIGTILNIILLTTAISTTSADLNEESYEKVSLSHSPVMEAVCYSHEIEMLEIGHVINSWCPIYNKREMNSTFLAKQEEATPDQTGAQH